MSDNFEVKGTNGKAPFTLKIHRGEGMALLAMDWKNGVPPHDFVGFAIEYREPRGDRFYVVKNRISFQQANGRLRKEQQSSRIAPFQKFRWVHFPRRADLDGAFTYRVIPVFMNEDESLSYGEAQEAQIELRCETYPGKLNVAFTRGYVSSQAFVSRFGTASSISTLLPHEAVDGLTFRATNAKTNEALDWMGFEARRVIYDLLDEALADPSAQVRVVAYELNEPELVGRLQKLGKRLKIIIDDSDGHKETGSAESQAEQMLASTAGSANVRRQHCRRLQHNKMIVVDGDKVKACIYGSTNFSWRGFFVQANNAVVVRGQEAIEPALQAFASYWDMDRKKFGTSTSAKWNKLGVPGIDAEITFSPHATQNAVLHGIADDIDKASSSLLFSLAFLYKTKGVVRTALERAMGRELFVYGMSDRKMGGIELVKPSGNRLPVYPASLSKNVPAPFSAEPTGGGGIRMHHKFVVIDFNQPSARVYLGSFNFSDAADVENGENLLLIRDRRVAVAYMVEAIRLFDAYHFRVTQDETGKARKKLELAKPPKTEDVKPWWAEYYSDPVKIRDRRLFA